MSANTVIDEFKKYFNVNADTSDVNFVQFQKEPYDSLRQPHEFGEKKCLLYRIGLTVFNVNITLRILAFKYETYAEVLKLEINVCNELLSKEIASCKNFLQRRRNMNLTFEILIKFAHLFETRRLIDLTIFQRQRSVTTNSDDEGIAVKCCSENMREKYLELNWTITWHIDTFEVTDFIEFYLNYAVLEQNCANKVKKKLEILVGPNLDFQTKLKLWKSLMEDLYGAPLKIEPTRKKSTNSTDVLEISDSESDESVIEIGSCTNPSISDSNILIID